MLRSDRRRSVSADIALIGRDRRSQNDRSNTADQDNMKPMRITFLQLSIRHVNGRLRLAVSLCYVTWLSTLSCLERLDRKWRHQCASFFKVSEADQIYAICNVCSKEIPHGGRHQRSFNTTNLIRHLKTSHITEFEQFE